MKNLLLLLLYCLFLLACAGEKKSPPKVGVASGKTAVGNFDYVFFVKNNGATPQPGDSLFFHCDVRQKGELIASTRKEGVLKSMEFPLEYSGLPQPLFEGLRMMSPGDSLYIQMLMNNDSNEVVSMDIKLERIQPKK